MTGVRSFYCLFPRHTADLPPPAPSLSSPLSQPCSHLSQTLLHPLLSSLVASFFMAFHLCVLSCTPAFLLLPWKPFPHQQPSCSLQHVSFHTYVAQDAWRAFLCLLSMIRVWQCCLVPGRQRSRRKHNLQRAESLSRSSGDGLLPVTKNVLRSDCF